MHQKPVNYSQGRVKAAGGEKEQGGGKALKVEIKQKTRRKHGLILITSGKLKVMNVFIFLKLCTAAGFSSYPPPIRGCSSIVAGLPEGVLFSLKAF